MAPFFQNSDDQIAFQSYKNAVQADVNTACYFEDFCGLSHAADITSFSVFKSEYEHYMMKYETKHLAEIKNCPKLYRAYRAHMREHYCRQTKPWPIAFELFYTVYLKPKLFREFVVFNEKGLKKVQAFYKWLDAADPTTKKPALVSMMHNGSKINTIELEAYINTLYYQKHNWKKLEEGEDVDEWVSQIRTNVIKLFRKKLALVKQIPGKCAKRHYFVHEICRVLLQFNKCFSKSVFSFESFLKTFIKKGLEFSFYNGVPEGMYLIAQFFPDMICDDCCPWINTETDNYSITNVPLLLEISTFYKLSWCHEYWSEEYHLCIY
jgi:hypothetical protein